MGLITTGKGGAARHRTHAGQEATMKIGYFIRIHPAVIAQGGGDLRGDAGGRFCLGLGSGEALNEHMLGDRWEPASGWRCWRSPSR